MKTHKKIFATWIFCFIIANTQGQIKVFDDNWISLGSLTKAFGVQIQPNGYTIFQPSVYGPYVWLNLTYSTHEDSKCYIVDRAGEHKFFVFGSGWIYSRGQFLGSDIRFKEDIQEIEHPLATICNLRGVSFRNKGDRQNTDSTVIKDKYGNIHVFHPDDTEYYDTAYFNPRVLDSLIAEKNRKHFGVIAQEVEPIAPDLVRTMPDGTKAVEYYSCIGLLIEAIKEQQQQINTLIGQVNQSNYSINFNQENNPSSNIVKNDHPLTSVLYQNSPNPFDRSTSIRFQISSGANSTSILILNMQGTLLKTYDQLDRIKGVLIINGNEFEPGMYLYTLIVNGEEIATKRMILTSGQ